MLTDLRPARAQRQLPPFGTAHEGKNIGTLLGSIMDKYGTSAIGLGWAGMIEAPDWGNEASRALAQVHHRMG
nr:hypothetical protein [Paenarthrobacter sp. DKR-5]